MTDHDTAIAGRRRLLGALGATAAATFAASAASTRAHAAPKETRSATGDLFFDVRDYGATGDGTTVDGGAIQSAIDAAADVGGGTVHLPAGEYLTTEPIRMADRVRLVGAGPGASVIRAANAAGWGAPHRFHGMIDMLGVVAAAVESLTLDQNGVGRVTSVSICHYTMLISGSRHCEVVDVRFEGHGLEGEGTWPSGPALLISSRDDASESLGSLPGHNTHDIRVSRCEFVQDDRLHQNFAIRVYTQFTSSTAPEPPMPEVITSDVTIEYCRFEGDVGWQTIEFSGKTQYSRVLSCNFRGKALSHIEFDKGASNCIAAFNMIEDSGKPPHLLDNTNTRVATIWDHGAGTDPVRCNLNNTIAFNTVRSVVTADAIDPFEAAITVGTWTKDCLVIGNQIDGVNGGTIGGAIHLQRNVDGAVVDANAATGVKYGVWFDWNFSEYNGIRVTNNLITCTGTGIEVRKLPGDGKDIVITGNRITTTGSVPAVSVLADTLEMPVVSHNTTEGGSVGFNVQCPAVLIGNVAKRASEASYDCGEGVTMIGNVSLDAVAGDLGGAETPSLTSNVFLGPDRDQAPKTTHLPEPPTTGTWRRGDTVYNSAPRVGQAFAWVCVTEGSPGEWRQVAIVRAR